MHRYGLPVAAAVAVLGMATPAMAAPSPLVGRFEAEQMATFNSNLLLAPNSPSDFLFRTKVGGTVRYSFPTKTLIMGQANYNLIRFASQDAYNSSLLMGNAMVMQPIFDFATVYGGAMGIVSHGDTPTGVWRFDKDLMLGGLLQTALSKQGTVFGGYHLDTMLTEVANSAFFGHTFQLGYRHALMDDLNLTAGYRFLWKDQMTTSLPDQGRHTVGLTGRWSFLKNILALQGRTEYTYVMSVDPNLNAGMLDVSLLLNGGF